MTVRTAFLCALLATIGTSSVQNHVALAEEPAKPPEYRRHLAVHGQNPVDDFEITEIQRLSEPDDITVVLIRTSDGDELIAKHEWNYEKQISYREIRDLRSDEFLRVTTTYSYSTRTRTATLQQARKSPQSIAQDAPFEITGPGNSRLSGIYSHWGDPVTAREWRTRIRQMISPAFLEKLERVDSTGLFSEPILSALHELVMQYLLYRTSCDSTANLRVDAAVPDCGFDKNFGYPCSEDQEKRAAAAIKAKKAQRY